MADNFFNPSFRGGVNPLDAFKAAQGLADDQRLRELQEQIAQQSVGGGNISQSPEFQQLTALNPQLAGQIANTQLGTLQQQMGIDQSRTEALFKDALTTKGLLGVSQGKALGFLDNRLQSIQQLGGNPADTLEVRELIASGNIKEARDLLDNTIKAGQQIGILPSQKAVAKQKAEGGLVFNPNTGTFSLDQVAAARIDQLKQKKDAGAFGVKERQSINKDITAITKDAVKVRRSAEELEGLKGRGTAAAKLGAVFKFMKALDPTSVVRETEQGQVYAAEGAGAQIAGAINSLLGEGKLTEKGFADLVETSKVIANSNLGSTQTEVNNLLNTFEDTLPNSFVEKVRARVPRPFQVNNVPVGVSQTGAPTQVIRFDAQGNPIGG